MIKFSSINKIILIGVVFIISLFFYSDSALAQVVYNDLVTVPYMPVNPTATDYLSGLYTFLTRVVGIIAMAAIVIGGARYLTSVGNPSAIEDAKHTINSAILGLILAISSWVIVTEINPDITVLKSPTMGVALVGTYDSSATASSEFNCATAGTGTNADPCMCIDYGNTETPVEGTAAAITAGDSCNMICATSSKALDGKYHCALADLKAGYSKSSVNIDDIIVINAGDTVYFDAKTYSKNPIFPGYKVNVKSDSAAFNNGVDSYIIQSDLMASGGSPKWNESDEQLKNLMYDYIWTKSPSDCSFWASLLSGLYNGISAMTDGLYTEGMLAYKFTVPGEYKAILNIYVADPLGVCHGIDLATPKNAPFKDRVYIIVK